MDYFLSLHQSPKKTDRLFVDGGGPAEVITEFMELRSNEVTGEMSSSNDNVTT